MNRVCNLLLLSGKRLLAPFCLVVSICFTVCAPVGLSAASAEELHSPVYIDFNTYIDRVNILELVSVGSRSVRAQLTFYTAEGTIRGTRTITIPSLNQFDVLVNDIVNQRNTYGLIKIEFDDVNTKLFGRMSVYRLNTTSLGVGTYSFAFNKDLRNPVHGTTYATGNTFDPQGRGFIVPNWLEIMNLEDTPQTFTHNLYDQGGTLLSSQPITVPSLGKFDVSSGHERGEGVYLNEVIPNDATADYIASVTRYASNSSGGNETRDFVYAMSRYAEPGRDEDQYSLIENRTGVCFNQTSWVEVANVASTAATATVTFYDETGNVEDTVSQVFQPKSQFHFNGSSLLDTGERGWVKVESDTADSLVVQSAVYFHYCDRNALQTAYLLPAQTLHASALIGSYNLFLGMLNTLVVIGADSVDRDLDVTVHSSGQTLFTGTSLLRTGRLLQLNLNDASVFETSPDSYGTVLLNANETPSFVPFILRERRAGTSNEIVDFVMPTIFGESDE